MHDIETGHFILSGEVCRKGREIVKNCEKLKGFPVGKLLVSTNRRGPISAQNTRQNGACGRGSWSTAVAALPLRAQWKADPSAVPRMERLANALPGLGLHRRC